VFRLGRLEAALEEQVGPHRGHDGNARVCLPLVLSRAQPPEPGAQHPRALRHQTDPRDPDRERRDHIRCAASEMDRCRARASPAKAVNTAIFMPRDGAIIFGELISASSQARRAAGRGAGRYHLAVAVIGCGFMRPRGTAAAFAISAFFYRSAVLATQFARTFCMRGTQRFSVRTRRLERDEALCGSATSTCRRTYIGAEERAMAAAPPKKSAQSFQSGTPPCDRSNSRSAATAASLRVGASATDSSARRHLAGVP
jgi:hypothetical protein